MVPPADSRLGFAFHDYPLCSSILGAAGAGAPQATGSPCATEDSIVLSNAVAHSAATGNALLETEFGATTDLPTLTQQLGRYDRNMVPWMFWSYTRYIDPSAGNGTLEPATDANVNLAMLGALARPYPQLVAGTPIDWGFDPNTKTFTLHYATERADGQGTFQTGSETDVAVPALQYPRGYVTIVAGGTVVSAPNAPVLRVRAAAGPGPVTISVRAIA